MDRPPSTLVHVPGPLLAALHVCHPGGLPAWLHRATPRCATGRPGVLRLDDRRSAQLADLAAAAWWECQRADGTELFTSVFARDCEAVLDRLAANRQTQTRTEGQTL